MPESDIHHTPALEAPYGVDHNFKNAYSLHPHLIATATVCLTASTFAVVARSYTKIRILRKFEIEDGALIFSALGFAAFAGVMIEAGNAGQGKHQWNVTLAGLQRIALLANILEVIYPPVMFAAKYAILLQIKRIFTAHQRNVTYWAVHLLIWTNFLVYVALFFAFVFACWPREKIWNPHLPGRCISTNASIIATSAINIISDFTILVLPMFSIARLQLSQRKKAAVAAVFGTGLFACIASIIRLYYSIKLTRTHDISWAIAPVGMWALAEFATVILVGCFPTFPRLWKHMRGLDVEESSSQPQSKSSERRRRHFLTTTNGYLSDWNDGKSEVSHGSWIPLHNKDNEAKENAMESTVEGEDVSRGPGIYKRTDIEMRVGDRE